MFTLPKPTYVTLTNLNPRVEKRGDENVSAIDLSIQHDAPNAVLDLFEPGLVLPGMDEETKPLTAEDVFIGGVVPGEAAAVH